MSRSKGVQLLNNQAAAARSTYHHGDLRNALIAAGRGLLEEMGPHDLSLREAARRVGVSIAAPSRHFEGKEALLAAIAASGFRELATERVKIIDLRTSSLDKAKQMMFSYVEFAQRHKGLFNLMVGPAIIERGEYAELVETSNLSFDLFSSAVSDYARENGWTARWMNLVVHSAWAIEHGVAMLIIGNRIPRSERPVELKEMIRFSVSMQMSAIAAGPEALKRVLK